MSNTLIILGAGGHGRVAADAALASDEWAAVGFVDNTPGLAGTRIIGLPVLAATVEGLADAAWAEAAVHVAIGDNATRRRVSETLAAQNHPLATIRHPSAVISPFARIEAGASVMAGAIIQPGAEIGEGAIINTGARIDHDCRIGTYAHISPGAVLAGNVSVGTGSWIGTGVAVRNGITIGDRLIIGVGAVVVADLSGSPRTRFVGVPAREL